jgi:UDP-N-acetylmuramate: L-alanyl-gamma-D-glutamyl-meso-diaminopimelate ligase
MALLRIHFIGIAGSGMGALAGLLRASGYGVTGSDQNHYPPMSTALAAWGISVRTPYSPDNLEPRPDLVVVGATIPPTNPELQAARARGLAETSFPEALASLYLPGRRPVVVAGTHGKTTCTALITHALYQAGRDPGFFVGGQPNNFAESFRVGSRRPGGLCVVEGDEYKTTATDLRPKFLHYRPEVLLCTSLEFDHGNVYAGVEEIRARFAELMGLVPDGGGVVLCAEEPDLALARAGSGCRAAVTTYGRGGDWTASEVVENSGGVVFRPAFRDRPAPGPVQLGLSGRHNILNGLGCYAVLAALGLGHEEIATGFAGFLGVRRRMELVGTEAGVCVIDDFAHHPTAVDVTLRAARVRHPGCPLWAVFEPRSITSCRRFFQEEYARAFDAADRVFFAPAYRDVGPDDCLDLHRLVEALCRRGRPAAAFATLDALVEGVCREARRGTAVLCMSSGSFGGVPLRLLTRLRASQSDGARPAPPGLET